MTQQLTPTLFARQEIYDTTGSVCAYELLYRDGESLQANIDPLDNLAGDNATSFVLSHLFTNLGLDSVIGNLSAYINFTRNHLLQKIPLLLPQNRVVIELLEHTIIDEPLLESIKLLIKEGFKFALDDFVFREDLIPLINLVQIIKIDVLNLSENEIKKQLALLKDFKGRFVAEKIENRKQLLLCKTWLSLFPRLFLNFPSPIQGQELSESKAYLLKLLTELHHPDVKIERVEEIILQIPKLSYRILRLANSPAMYIGKKIESLLEAIQQLGLVQIRNWISLILVSSLDEVTYDLLERTLIRAKMCQILARSSGLVNSQQAYTVGMFSALDTILNEPMASLLSKIQLSEELNDALLHKRGILGQLLSLTQHYEQARFDLLDYTTFTTQDYSQAYLKGIDYANTVMDVLR
ncbi:EAL and HDOD domain-containing protein [Legionella tunisiensis]|uniref:EAL and HDOD domain-containing protein n=1 Tax=Legionella tunisiensis TaxID=1034944 RepID=UPI0002FD22C8|nr:HDOD domain-containing protein [Legionella tunisiensis]